MSEKMYFRTRNIISYKGHYIMISGRVLQEYIEILNVYPSNNKTSKYLKKKKLMKQKGEFFFNSQLQLEISTPLSL